MNQALTSYVRRTADVVFSPFTALSSVWLNFVTRKSIDNMPVSEFLFMKAGVLPVKDHYYQPLINPKKHLKSSLRADRSLPAIDLNIDYQLELLTKFNYNEELKQFPLEKPTGIGYYYNNGSFLSGDSEYLYNIIRHYKPKMMIEIGSGNSTLMARNALKQNESSDNTYTCNHICIEPYEMPWLEKTGVTVVRKKIEEIGSDLFKQLQAGDILFIDSSHIIRPQGDVLVEYLQILPVLKKGVLIHIHDIFTPKDYLNDWIYNKHLLWNEQYLVEAFLSFNKDFKIIGALNYLHHNHFARLASICPILSTQPDREPGSFWLERT